MRLATCALYMGRKSAKVAATFKGLFEFVTSAEFVTGIIVVAVRVNCVAADQFLRWTGCARAHSQGRTSRGASVRPAHVTSRGGQVMPHVCAC